MAQETYKKSAIGMHTEPAREDVAECTSAILMFYAHNKRCNRRMTWWNKELKQAQIQILETTKQIAKTNLETDWGSNKGSQGSIKKPQRAYF